MINLDIIQKLERLTSILIHIDNDIPKQVSRQKSLPICSPLYYKLCTFLEKAITYFLHDLARLAVQFSSSSKRGHPVIGRPDPGISLL